MSLGERVKKARKHANGMSQVQLATAIRQQFGRKISQQTIAKIESPSSRSTTFIPHIATLCGVSVIWLAEGKGPMIPGKRSVVSEERAIYNSLSKEAVELARAWEKLPRKWKEKIYYIVTDTRGDF